LVHARSLRCVSLLARLSRFRAENILNCAVERDGMKLTRGGVFDLEHGRGRQPERAATSRCECIARSHLGHDEELAMLCFVGRGARLCAGRWLA
jgi:hypothetical protein